MRRIALVLVFLTGLTAPAFAQKAAIEAVNARWTELFNKGDFAGVASLYAEDATAFPPGSGMVKGRAAIEAMWKGMADQVGDPLGVLHIGLASRHVADVAGIADDQLKVPFQNRIDRFPVDARTFHADMRDAQFLQPVPQPSRVGHQQHCG